MDTNRILHLIVPEDILTYFDLVETKEGSTFTELYLEEKKGLIPATIKAQDVVLDGFCNPLSLLTYPLKALPTYLVIKRRRWKLKGGVTHYSNDYDFNHPNIKATKEFAAFLKEVHGHTPDEYIGVCRTYGY